MNRCNAIAPSASRAIPCGAPRGSCARRSPSDGSPASFGRIVGLRYLTTSVLASIPLAGTVYGLLDVLRIFRASRRCLHDNIADTILVTA